MVAIITIIKFNNSERHRRSLNNQRIMKKIHFAIILLSVFLTSVGKVFAHDPGTSFAHVVVSENNINLTITYNLSDIETLVIINTNHDEQYSQTELDNARAELIEQFSKGIEFRIENTLRAADDIDLSIEKNENLILKLDFSITNTSTFSLYMPILKQFPRGHRQYFLANKNNESYQHVLSADSKPIYFNLTSNNSAATFIPFYLQGIGHIFAGFDHILFLLTLLLPTILIFSKNNEDELTKLKPVMIDTFKIITAFTLAHSITLGLAVMQVIQLPGRLVESMIAFSIIVCAINNLKPILPTSRWTLALVFGLIHGFGFASALADLGVESKKSMIPLLGFNLGIETGQLAIVMLVLPIIYIIRHSNIFRIWIFKGGSIVTILIASVWMLERTI